MNKLLLALYLLTLVACGPLSKAKDEKKTAAKEATAEDVARAAEKSKDEPAKPEDAVSNSESKGKGADEDDEDEDEGPHQSPNQAPNQSPTQAPAEAPPLTISAIRYSGSACPHASVAANISPDRKAFTLLFDSFAIDVPELIKGQTRQADCELEIDLLSVKGWQLTLLTVDERGYAALNEGDVATLTTDFSFFAKGPSAHFQTRLEGAMDDTFQRRAEARLLTSPWSGCERTKTLYVKLGAKLKAATNLPAYLAVDAVDGELHHEAGLAFRRCE